MTHSIAKNVSILIVKYGVESDFIRNIIGFSINEVFASLNTEYHEKINNKT